MREIDWRKFAQNKILLVEASTIPFYVAVALSTNSERLFDEVCEDIFKIPPTTQNELSRAERVLNWKFLGVYPGKYFVYWDRIHDFTSTSGNRYIVMTTMPNLLDKTRPHPYDCLQK